jgi:hypothetical protein
VIVCFDPQPYARVASRIRALPDIAAFSTRQDLARRGGGSGGIVHPGQPEWLERELAGTGERWLLVVSHQPLTSSADGGQILELLDRHPRVIAALSAHIHRNRIVPRPTRAGGYWLIGTASLIDYPRQARAIRVLATDGGGLGSRPGCSVANSARARASSPISTRRAAGHKGSSEPVLAVSVPGRG